MVLEQARSQTVWRCRLTNSDIYAPWDPHLHSLIPCPNSLSTRRKLIPARKSQSRSGQVDFSYNHVVYIRFVIMHMHIYIMNQIK
jgi:hypothetical protein